MRTYTIDGCNEMFLTLQEAKKHIWLAYTPKECYSINKTSIRKNYSGVTEIVELKSK